MKGSSKKQCDQSLRSSMEEETNDVLDTEISSISIKGADLDREEPAQLVDETDRNNATELMEKVLHNSLILDHCFQFLGMEDIKASRLVCSQWNTASIPFLKRKSIISFFSPGQGIPSEQRSPDRFKDLFRDSEVGTNFSAFKLHQGQEYIWTVADFVEFLEDNRHNMKELSIENIFFEEAYSTFDLDPFIEPHLSHLSINNSERATNFNVSLEKLSSSKSLSLQKCTVDVKNCSLLTQPRLELINVTIKKDGKWVKKCKVNEIINLEAVKELTLECDGYNKEVSTLSLDLDGQVTLDNLKLAAVDVLNFEKAAWVINGKLELIEVPYIRRNQMIFKELAFKFADIDLSVLPESIEKLTLEKYLPNTDRFVYRLGDPGCYCSRDLYLPNLEYLHFIAVFYWHIMFENDYDDYIDADLSFVNVFSRCQNLKTVKLSCDSRPKTANQILNTAWLPPRTQYLFLSGNIEVAGKEFKLTKLVVTDSRFTDLLGMLRTFKPKILVLDFNSDSLKEVDGIEQVILGIVRESYEKIALGLSAISNSAFRDILLSKFGVLDTMSDYYLFENQSGKVIKESEFKEIIDEL